MQTSDDKVVIPRSPAVMVADLLKEYNVSQNKLAETWQVSRQAVSQLLSKGNGTEAISEEKVYDFARLLKIPPAPLVKEMSRYAAWKKTAEGKDYERRLRANELKEIFNLRGPRFLSQQEIVEAIEAGLFMIYRITSLLHEEDKFAPLEFDGDNIVCHYRRHTRGEKDSDDPEPVIGPFFTATVQSEEVFNLGAIAKVHVNGVSNNQKRSTIRYCSDLLTSFPAEAALIFNLDNFSDKEVRLKRGDHVLKVLIWYNPFS